MIYGLYVSAAGMMANDYRQDVVANNLANAQTAGFKPDISIFQQRLTERMEDGPRLPVPQPVFEQLPGGLQVYPTRTQFVQGALESTGRQLDVALVGEGFLKVSQDDQINYTRDGRFELAKNGKLQTLSGSAVLDENDQPIRLDRRSDVVITRDGGIYQQDERVATLGVVDLPEKTSARKLGSNLFEYRGTQPPVPAANTVIEPGFIESSEADPVQQMTLLIQATRAYQANATLITYQDQTLGRAVNDVGRLA